jgi:hypothetical protein
MSEWWSYSLSDFLLFSPRTYYRLFELHNEAVWPGHLLVLALGIAILVLLLRSDGRWRDRTIAGILAACWGWVAWSFLFTRYASINWAAPYLAVLFAAEAVLLVLAGAVMGKLRFRVGFGIGLFLFALLIQPMIGPLVGRDWSQAEFFGIAPDPTAVGTLGVLLLASGLWHWVFLAIPLLWCVVSGATLWTMGTPDAVVLPAAALLTLGLAIRGFH